MSSGNSIVDRFESEGGCYDYPKDMSVGYEYGNKYFSFEQFLSDEFAKKYIGNSDNFESSFDNFLEDMEPETMMNYADSYGLILFNKGKNNGNENNTTKR